MNIRIFRKAFGLLIVDIVIIIGIFVLQFRTDSNIIEKLGDLQITLEYSENQQDSEALKNKFLVNYRGFSLSGDDKKSVQIVKENSTEKQNVQLVKWQKKSDLSCQFFFTDDVSFILSLSSDSPTATLSASAVLPSSVTELYVPYSYSYNMKILKNEGNKLVLNDKKSSWEISALNFDNGYLTLNHKNLVASYAAYDDTKKFTFDSLVELAISEKEAFDLTVNNFRTNLISAYKANNSESSITEQTVVSYIAAMAVDGNYMKAIEDIPQSFKKSKQRTYLSAPYLNTLETMNEQLDAAIKDVSKTISNYAASLSLDFFNSRNIASHLCVHGNKGEVERILENAGNADTESLTIAQATGIIQAFVDLSTLNPEYAKLLMPALSGCIDRIKHACVFDGNVLTLSENDTFLSVVQAVETGIALYRYGVITGNDTLVRAGRVIVNSYISESASFDLRTLSNVYPIIAYDNTYYPHYEQIQTDDGKFVWAWTCAKSIFYESDSQEDTITLNIDFPEGYTHYLIIKGIPAFTSIYIYNLAFRTDPRFETYNSSGYVYKTEENTLLLKSRHKTRFETIRMEYDEELARRRAEEEAERAEKAKLEAEQAAATAENTPAETTTEPVAVPAAVPAATTPVNSSVPPRGPNYPQYQR